MAVTNREGLSPRVRTVSAGAAWCGAPPRGVGGRSARRIRFSLLGGGGGSPEASEPLATGRRGIKRGFAAALRKKTVTARSFHISTLLMVSHLV